MVVYNNSMKKILNFCKTNFIIAKWTVWYFLTVWLILKYVFGFDMFSRLYWWKFFHAHLRGFVGFVFGALVYAMIPIYIASVMVIYRTKESIIKIPLVDTIYTKIKNIFISTKAEPVIEETTPEPEQPKFEYPDNLPTEMRIPFKRIKERTSMSTIQYKTQEPEQQNTNETSTQPESFPIPTDFDINDNQSNENFVPTFTDVNFDTAPTVAEQENTMTKYLKNNNIEYETYNDFIITQKHLIYVHNDSDFWIIDDDNWFASGKQIDSPVPIMLDMAKNEHITPVIYFETTNIMDLDGTKEKLNDQGIIVITRPDELKF